ncbi:MAG: glycerate kinase [Candidatus Nitrosocaldaceae archaeon]
MQNSNFLINKKELIKGSNSRRLVLNTIDYALREADPKRIIYNNLRVEDNTLIIKNNKIRLDFKSIYVIGGGKASASMAKALEVILGDKIRDGLVIIPDYQIYSSSIIRFWKATHPIPSIKGVEGVKRLIELADKASSDDLIICLISGGCSALMPLPYDGITLEEKQEITRRLLRAGANIEEINTVRKHISSIKGGRLVEILKDKNILSLIISDVIGDKLDTIASGLTVGDTTTFNDAKSILVRYNLWNEFESIKSIIEDGIKGKIKDTPKPHNPIFKNVKNIILANNEFICIKAREYMINHGINAKILTTTLQGEAKDVGLVLASITREIEHNNRPFSKPIGLIAGGETVVTLHGDGKGGRNQEMMLSALRVLKDSKRYTMAAIATDGRDGNSNAAGAIIDVSTLSNALDINEFLLRNDSNTFFVNVNDAIYTSSDTNLNDIIVILVD